MWLPVVHRLAPQRAPLRRPAGPEQGRDGRKYGDEQVLVWRRSYDTPPPALEADDPRGQRNDPRYAGLDPPSR